jgi:cytochrome c-type biogenesis protein
MNDVSLWAAFGAGLASFITPCVLPMVPVYLATLAGSDILDPAKLKRLPLFLHALFFVLGFTIVYTMMGALVGLLGITINPFSSVVRWVSGGLLLLFGLFMLGSLFIPALNFEKRLSPKTSEKTSYLRSLLIGAVFPLAWTACTGPILGSILTLAYTSETAWKGAFLLAIYSIGLGVPFLLIGLFFSALRPILRKISRYSRWIYALGGILLVAIGILIIIGKLNLLAIQF